MSSTASRITMLAAAISLAVAAPAAAQLQAPAPTGGAQAIVDAPGLTVSPGVLLARTLTIRGRTVAGPRDAGRPVSIERQLLDGTWQQIAGAVAGPDGSFRTTWRTDQLGRVTLRASVDRGQTATAAGTPLTAQVTVFKGARTTWYGPGFFGRRTACGIRLTRRTIGVAHRKLPCGTLVPMYHRGRVLTVPVIDRGPFKKGRAWDLTQAAARALGVRGTTRIGVLPPLAATPLR